MDKELLNLAVESVISSHVLSEALSVSIVHRHVSIVYTYRFMCRWLACELCAHTCMRVFACLFTCCSHFQTRTLTHKFHYRAERFQSTWYLEPTTTPTKPTGALCVFAWLYSCWKLFKCSYFNTGSVRTGHFLS